VWGDGEKAEGGRMKEEDRRWKTEELRMKAGG
jgi:hypothetical protein